MKKTVRQKRFEWEHLMSVNNFSKPYMLRHNSRLTGKRGKRFKIDRFAKTVHRAVWEHENIPFFGGRYYTVQRGVGILFPQRIIRILSSYN